MSAAMQNDEVADDEPQETLLQQPQIPSNSLNDDRQDVAQFVGTCKLLYVSHFLSAWNSRVFEFAAFLFLADIYPGTLLPASIYALLRAAAATFVSPWIGAYIDTAERLHVVKLSIVGQRLATALSCGCFLAMAKSEALRLPGPSSSLLLSVLSLLACVEKLSAVMNTVAVERDWVVVIASGNEGRLRSLNSQMRRIDLFCKLCGPLAIALVDGYSTSIAIIVVAAMTALSITVEYPAIVRVFQRAAALSTPKVSFAAPPGSQEQRFSMQRTVFKMWSQTADYVRHPAFLPSFALSLLYLTILSFAGQMITYLIALGMSSGMLGVLRGISAAFELSATWLAPKTVEHIGPVRAGIWFLNWQLFCVIIACLFIWLVPDATTAAAGTVASVIASRVGLWGFDLSAQIIIQEEVEEQSRGTFSAREQALQNLFEMIAFGSTIVFSDPASFKYPALMSAIAVTCAGILYAAFVRLRRGHLVHLSSCIDRNGSSKDHHHWWMLKPLDSGAGRYSRVEQ